MDGWDAVVAAYFDERDLWPDVGQHRVLSLLAFRTLDVVERMRSPGDGRGPDGEAVLLLAGAALLFLDKRYGPVDVVDLQHEVEHTDRDDVAGWRDADDPRVAWQTDVLVRLSSVFMDDASQSGHEPVTRALLTYVIAACVDYADWAELSWPPSKQ